MTTTEVERFVSDVRTSAKLQAALKDKVRVSDLVEVANNYGYNFTEEDVQNYAKHTENHGELTEQQLETVAGGLWVHCILNVVELMLGNPP